MEEPIKYSRSKAGFMFPTYKGKILSWTISSTLEDEQENYPRLRIVIRAMMEKRSEQLEQERRELVKGTFDPIFGNNARKVLRIVEEEIAGECGPNGGAR